MKEGFALLSLHKSSFNEFRQLSLYLLVISDSLAATAWKGAVNLSAELDAAIGTANR